MPHQNDSRSDDLRRYENLSPDEKAGIFPTDAGTFRVKWREGKKQKAKTRKTLDAALEYKRNVDEKRGEGLTVVRTNDVPTLEELSNRYLAKLNVSDRTLALYADIVSNHLYPHLGHLPVHHSALTPLVLTDWLEAREEEGAGRSTLAKTLGLSKRILSYGVRKGYLTFNPATEIPAPQWEKKPHRWLDAAEVELLRGWYLERDDAASATLVSCMAYVGLRPQMFLAARTGSLLPSPPTWVPNPGRGSGSLLVTERNSLGTILPGSKTSDESKALVYVPGPVMADIESMGVGTGLLFSRKDGQPWTKTNYDNWRDRAPRARGTIRKQPVKVGGKSRDRCFKAAAEDCGLGADLKPYDLRHTGATLYAAVGWSDHMIARQQQNSATTSKQIYQHLLDRQPDGGTMDELIEEARGGPERLRLVS